MKTPKHAKRGFSIITALALIVSVSVSGITASAVGYEDSAEERTLISSTTIDEYSMIKNLQSKSDKQLLHDGYDIDQIKSLKALDFIKELKKISKLSVSELKGRGYSEDGIQRLKSLGENPTEDQVMAASSNLTINVYAGSRHGHHDDFSWAVFSTDWSWSSRPAWNETDIVAIAWSEGMYLTSSGDSSYTYAWVDYYNDDDGKYWSRQNYSSAVTPDLNRGASLSFRQGQDMGGASHTIWAKNGSMGVKLTKQANVPEMCVQVAYGHSQLAATPSVSFSVSGTGASASIGISFSWGVSSLDSDYKYLSL